MQFKEWLMKSPTFSIIGGKARLRDWLISNFPQSGRIYFEPFAGRGNVFYKARTILDFQEWHLNDKDGFLSSIVTALPENLPPNIPDKETWNYWKNLAQSGDPTAISLTGDLTFGGKGWHAGHKGIGEGVSHGNHVNYKKENFIKRFDTARELLKDVKITNLNWENLNWKQYNSQDFVYLDPPYNISKNYYAEEVNHVKLLSLLKSASFRWAISGYNTELYQQELNGFRKVVKSRGSELKGSNTQKLESVEECLWMNY